MFVCIVYLFICIYIYTYVVCYRIIQGCRNIASELSKQNKNTINTNNTNNNNNNNNSFDKRFISYILSYG